MDVFLLWHTHLKPDGEEDVKLLGVYATEERALRRIEEAKGLPGFAESQGGFEVSRYEVDRDEWTEGFVTVMHG